MTVIKATPKGISMKKDNMSVGTVKPKIPYPAPVVKKSVSKSGSSSNHERLTSPVIGGIKPINKDVKIKKGSVKKRHEPVYKTM